MSQSDFDHLTNIEDKQKENIIIVKVEEPQHLLVLDQVPSQLLRA